MSWFDPSEEMKRLQKQMNRFFENLSATVSAGVGKEFPSRQFREPLADIKDLGRELLITVEVPGAKKEEIELHVTEDEISIKAERKEHVTEKRENYLKSERSQKGFYRSLKLPARVMPKNVHATYRDGLLVVRLKKAQAAKKAKKVKVLVKS